MRTTRRVLMVTTALSLVMTVIVLREVTLPDEILRLPILLAGLVAAVTFVVMAVLEIRSMRSSWQLPEPEDPPSSDQVIEPRDPVSQAAEAMDYAESYAHDAQDRVRIKIDIEDSREEDVVLDD